MKFYFFVHHHTPKHASTYFSCSHRFGGFGEIPKRLSGHVEQVICAGGRTFVGTTHSTFTSYIMRLRGYMHAPDQRRFIHSVKGAMPAPDRFDLYTEMPWLWDAGLVGSN
jgi:hypothetical protein